MKRIVKFTTFLLLGALTISAVPRPASAHGWGGGGWHGGGWGGGSGGFGIGLGYGVAPFLASPYYYAPPVVYAPPPVYYAPPSYYYSPPVAPSAPTAPPQPSASIAGQSCNAGSYVCPMEVAVPAGARCYCPGNDGNRIYGSAQ